MDGALENVAALLVYALLRAHIFLFTMAIGSISSISSSGSGGEMRLTDILREYDSETMVKRRFCPGGQT
jgi:hypothetical protein